ncbi:N-6 DNA methylase [Candidatus Poriferisocius sp.]|uniref:N-6 DNA methylase n=1 Tax=Candidatus Poriferisocius sp. TaxID=3101276 RepID=UPI003B0257DA
MSDLPSRTTVNIRDIAEITGFRPSAVGNWRKRHSDFPVADSSGRFDLSEVERWLIENGKIDSRVPATFARRSLIDSLQMSGLHTDEITELLVSVLVYLEASDTSYRSSHQSSVEVTVSENDRWTRLRQFPADEVGEKLCEAARSIEEENRALKGLLADGLSAAPKLPGTLLVSLIENFDATNREGTPRFSQFDDVVSRIGKRDRFRGEHSTPADIAMLMIQLAGQNANTVCDLACGEGGLLSSAALSLQPRNSKPINLVGFDVDEGALRVAKSRFLIQGVTADLRLSDSFRVPQEELPLADIVLLDPPLGLSSWGDADIYMDKRWRFGAPPRSNADLAWLQLAIQCLSESGVAVVGTSTGTASHRSGPEAGIRKAMLEEGAIKAVIQLPSRMRSETSVPIFLWVLQPPRPGADSVLLVDASTLGTASRSRHNFDSEDIHRIARTLQALEAGTTENDEIAQVVSIAEIINNDAILEPKQYRPIPEFDTEDAQRRSRELREKLPETTEIATSAIERLPFSNEKSGSRDSAITRALEEVADIYMGTNAPELEDPEHGTLLIGLREVSSGGTGTARYVDKESSTRPPVEIREGDVVVALRGDVGGSILATRHHQGAVLDQGCALIRPNHEEVTAPWVYLWTQSQQFRDRVSRASTGATTPFLSSRALADLAIPIPSAEQLDEAEQLLGRFDEALKWVGELQSDLTALRRLEVDLLIPQESGTE